MKGILKRVQGPSVRTYISAQTKSELIPLRPTQVHGQSSLSFLELLLSIIGRLVIKPQFIYKLGTYHSNTSSSLTQLDK